MRRLYTQSEDFPTTPRAFDRTWNGGLDVFLTQLNPDGRSLTWSTYLGGTGDEEGHSVALDDSHNAVLTGFTSHGDFPTSQSPFDPSLGGPRDAFVSKVRGDCTVPVAVEDLEATEHEGRVRLAWRLAREAQDNLLGVRVERAEAAEGPYKACTTSRLEPEDAMSFEDPDVENGREYWYRLVLVFGGGAEQVAAQVRVRTGSGGSLLTTLYQPRELPGDEGVEIRYSLARGQVSVRLGIYDARGREIWSVGPNTGEPGEHRRTWNERDRSGIGVARGVYFVRLEAGNVAAARKFVLVPH